MRVTRSPLNLSVCASLVLGQVSMWMGTVVAVAWAVLFSIMARHVWTFRGEASALALPLEPPLIGLALAGVALLLAALGRQHVPTAALAGAVLNGLALALAVAMLAGCLA